MRKLTLLLSAVLCASNLLAQKPNVLVIMADDVGLGDISFYRGKHTDNLVVETPNIDLLAENGVAFTNAHSPAALCAPSRYSMMTGNATYRSSKPWGVWGAYEESPISESTLTMAEMMQESGYKTAFFGKWHIGGDWRRKDDPSKIYRGSRSSIELDVDITKQVGGGPEANGFDYNFTYPAGIQDVPYAVYENSVWMPLKEDSKIGVIMQEDMDKIGVTLDKMEGQGDINWDPHDMGPLLVNKAVEYINNNVGNDEPFFMYYCSQAVHLPHTPTDSLNGAKIKGATPVYHLDMVVELDEQVAMMVQALKDNNVYDSTLIIFTSDNGGLTRGATLNTGHRPSDIYRGGKNQVFEGGHRVPFIASWPGKIEASRMSDEAVIANDIFNTLAVINEYQLGDKDAMDSHNLLPLFFNQEEAKGHDYMLIQGGTSNEVCLIEGDWKLIIQTNSSYSNRMATALYNLKDNPEENSGQNLINSENHKARVDAMFTKYNSTKDGGKRTTEIIMFEEEEEEESALNSELIERVSIHPNPANDEVIITGVEDNFNVQCFDMSGKMMFESNNEKYIDLADINPGIYNLRLDVGTQVLMKRLIKE